MDVGRVVAVRAGQRHGSGYLIGRRLVLSSAHVCPGVAGAVVLWLAGGGEEFSGVVVWRGTGGGPDDAALVAVTDRAWVAPRLPPVRWGRVVTNRAGLPVETCGFPGWIQRRDAPAETWHVTGVLNPGSRYVGDRFGFTVTGTAPAADGGGSPWAGLSGAGMFHGELLTGVVAADLAGGGHGQLDVVPVAALLRDAAFRTALSAYGVRGVELEAAEAVGLAEAEPPVGGSPAALLRARVEAVGFRGRAALMAELEQWCEPSSNAAGVASGVGVRLLYAPGGQGKTRIGQELDRRLQVRWWATVWLGRNAETGLDVLADAAVPLLVIVDYAETRTEQVAALLRACAGHRGAAPLRVLLLARTAGDWWADLQTANPAGAALLDGAPVDKLPELDRTPVERSEAYRQAVTDLAEALTGLPGREKDDWPAAARRLPAGQVGAPGRTVTALGVQMTALADLLDTVAPPTTASTGSVEDRLLQHEQAYWWGVADALRLHPSLSRHTLSNAVALMVLFGAATSDEADLLLSGLPALRDQPRDRRDLVRVWIGGLYPAQDGRPWGQLEPDRIAERFAGIRLTIDPKLPDPAVLAATEVQAAQLLTVYARAANQPAFAERLRGHLTSLVLRHPAALLGAAVDVATRVEAAKPLLDALECYTANPDTTLTELQTVYERLPLLSHALAEIAAGAAEQIVDRHRRRIACQHDDADLANRAATSGNLAISLNNLSIRLGDVGRREEGLAAIQEAVEVYRRLAEDRPDAFLPNLATSLNNLSIRLSDVGRREEGLAAIQEAVEVYRHLAKDRPDAFLPNLATSLNNLSIHLGDVGRREEGLAASQESVEVYRQLAQARPDAFLPGLANALNNLSIRLGSLGRREDGLVTIQEAVGVYRRLARARPDAFLPDLASSLNNLSNRLGGLARWDVGLAASQEAVGVYRRLAQARPDAFLPDLASSLNNLSNRLSGLGRWDESLTVIQEAVEIRRRLAEDRPEAFLPDLASSLNNLSNRLGGLGQWEEGLTVVQEAAKIYRQLAEDRPEAFLADLAASLNNLSVGLGELGRRQEGLTAIQQAVKIRQQLALAQPGLYRTELERSQQILVWLQQTEP